MRHISIGHGAAAASARGTHGGYVDMQVRLVPGGVWRGVMLSAREARKLGRALIKEAKQAEEWVEEMYEAQGKSSR